MANSLEKNPGKTGLGLGLGISAGIIIFPIILCSLCLVCSVIFIAIEKSNAQNIQNQSANN